MADSPWMQRIETGLGELARRAHRRPATALVACAAVTVLGVLGSSRLSLVADLEQLLPKTFQSVRDLEPVRQRFGGIGYVCLVGIDAEPDAMRRFADDMVPKLQKLAGIRYVEYQRPFKFFEERSLYFLDLEDLREVARRIQAREKWERRQRNPMFIKLDDEPAPPLDFSDIEAKYGRRTDQRLAGTGEDYYLDPDKRMVVLLAKPTHTSADLAFSQKLIDTVEEFLVAEGLSCVNCDRPTPEGPAAAAARERYGPKFRVGLTGTFKYKIDQQRQIAADITSSSTLAFLVLIGYLLFHFRSLLGVLFVVLPVVAGLTWTYGLAFLAYGGVNVLTGFLGAILGGLGFEHGIHLLGRYGVLRGAGTSSEDAAVEAFRHTGTSALTSSLVASLTFLAISYSEFRAFREFGLIASVGMLVILFGYVAMLPALLGIAARRGWKPGGHAAVSGAGSELSRNLPRWRLPIAAGVGAGLVALVVQIPGIRFDYDFHSLEDSRMLSFTLDHETNQILGYSQEPVVILTERAESERGIVQEFKRRKNEGGGAFTVDFVAALDDLVPQDQTEKQSVLESIGRILDKVSASKLDPDARTKFERLRRWVRAQPFTRPDIPTSVRRQFEGIGDGKGGFVLIFPAIKLSDGQAVRVFARDVRGIELPGGERFSAAGEAMILADVLEMVIRESRPVLIAAVLSVLVAMWLTLGRLRLALLCMTPTVLSILGLVGYMARGGLPFNYLNILIVPVLIGTTVDAGVHLVSRISESRGNFAPVFAETGRAICGGLLTSAVGFGALLLADHPGLNSLGRLANLGFAINLVIMIVWFPAVLLVLEKRLVSQAAPAAAGAAEARPASSGGVS